MAQKPTLLRTVPDWEGDTVTFQRKLMDQNRDMLITCCPDQNHITWARGIYRLNPNIWLPAPDTDAERWARTCKLMHKC